MKAVILLSALGTMGFSGDTFSRLVGVEHPWEYRFGDLTELADGSIAVVNGTIMEDLQVFLFDLYGGYIGEAETLSVPGRALESGGWLVPLSQGGFYMVSYSEPRATGVDSDIAVFRVSRNYQVEWKRKIGEGTDQVFSGFGAAGIPEGGVAVLGGEGYGGERAFLRAYGPGGDVSWEYDYNGEDGYLPVTLGEVDDGILVLMTHQWLEESFLQKFDGHGNMEWEIAVPLRSNFGPSSFCQLDSGYGVFFCGDSDGERSGVTLLASREGDLVGTWVFQYEIRLEDALIEDGSRLILAGSQVLDGENYAVLEALDYQGNSVWKRLLAGCGEAGFTGVCRSADGGYLLTGYCITEDGNTGSGYMLVKTDPTGYAGEGEDTGGIAAPVFSEPGE